MEQDNERKGIDDKLEDIIFDYNKEEDVQKKGDILHAPYGAFFIICSNNLYFCSGIFTAAGNFQKTALGYGHAALKRLQANGLHSKSLEGKRCY